MDITQYQQELFPILEEFFERATGKKPAQFATVLDFDRIVPLEASNLSHRYFSAFHWAFNNLQEFYKKFGFESFDAAQKLGGCKVVLGGSGGGRLTATHLESIRKMVLYTDTVLIPDPILPWIETSRDEEKFQHILLLKAAFLLLQMKPLVEANLPYPPIALFPSWEKSLEAQDPQTEQMAFQLITDVVSLHGGLEIETFEELRQFASDNPNDFLNAIEDGKLFVAPGGQVGEPLAQALERYRKEITTWRSSDHVERLKVVPKSLLALNAICERLNLQHHLLENADELNAHPLLCVPQQWHYYQLCSSLYQKRLQRLSLLEPATEAGIHAMNSPDLRWIGNLSFDDLTEIRGNNENETFRRHLQTHLNDLHSASLSDTNRVVAEITRGIASLLAEHQKKVKEIEAKFKTRHAQTFVTGLASTAVTLLPSLAPFFAAATPFVLLSKYGWDKLDERQEKKKLSRSLMGILATAKRG